MIGNVNFDIGQGRRVFKIKHYLAKVILVNTFTTGAAVLAVFSMTNGGGVLPSTVLSLVAVVLIFAGLAMINRFSEIVFDSHGISRRILGKTLQVLRWDNVKVIKKFRIVSAGFGSKAIDAYSIYPLVKPSGVFIITGSIGFSEGFENMGDLIEVINFYARKHSIKIEIPSNGSRVEVKQL